MVDFQAHTYKDLSLALMQLNRPNLKLLWNSNFQIFEKIVKDGKGDLDFSNVINE